MTDLETQLHEALLGLDNSRPMSGPSLRRSARRRTVRTGAGGLAVVGAAAVAGVVVAPGLLDSPASRVAGAAGASSSAASRAPVAAPSAEPSPTASVTAAPAASSPAQPTPSTVWSPAGSLIDNATVLADAPEVVATDSGWTAWNFAEGLNEGPLLSAETVQVVYAGTADIFSSGSDTTRPLVVVTGRAAANGPLQVAVLTSAMGAADPMKLDALTVEAMHPAAADGPQAIAVENGLTTYVAAETGVDSATFTYTDSSGTHTAPMTVTNGVALAATPMADLKASANGKITNVTAYSHGTVVWDAAPLEGR
jgi:hypothetical protein